MNIEVKMTPRLYMVAGLTPKCSLVADVGCDHGYLPVYLVKKGICEKAIASDVNKGPLEAAKRNIADVRVKDRIETVLSDGLKNIDNADCVTIAGMGGELICEILEGRKDGMKQFVLQPQRSSDILRRYLAQNGFEIEKEAVCAEGDKMYCAFFARFTGKSHEISEREALLGKYELFSDKEAYKKYAEYRKKEIDTALSAMDKAGVKNDRYEQLICLEEVYRGEMNREA